MSLILPYILLSVCICCICGLCIAMRRRCGRRMPDVDEFRAGLRHIIESIDAIAGEECDDELRTRLTDIREEARGLLSKAEMTADANNGIDVTSQSQKIDYMRPSTETCVVTDNCRDRLDAINDDLVEKAMKYVEANMHRADLSVEQLSDHLGVSRVHLYNKIKVTTELTPIEFIRIIRLRRAAVMLREEDMTVAEVAGKVGFNTPRIFSRYFRDEYGMLPSLYQTNNHHTEP